MGRLSSALTDTARTVRVVATGTRVEGRSPTVDVHGAWVPARLVVQDQREREEERGLRSVQHRATLILPPGTDLLPSNRIEVRSAVYGDQTWNVTGAPERVATRRSVRAIIATVERTSEPVRDEAGLL